MKINGWGGWCIVVLGMFACNKNNPTFCDTDEVCPTDMQCATEKYCTDGFTLDSTAFYVDGETLWSATATPDLHGYVTDAGAEIKLFDGDIEVAGPAMIEGTTWHLAAPALLSDGVKKQLRIVQTNDGSHVELVRTFAGDLTAPTARVNPSQSSDESKDVVTWNTDGTPVHAHRPFPIVIDGSHCAALPRYQHLFATGEPYALESAANPMTVDVRAKARFPFSEATRFRVLKNDVVMTDWTPVVTTVDADERVSIFGIDTIASPTFAENSGAYVAEYEFVDWAGRITTTRACWSIELLPPPLEIAARANTSDARSLTTWRYGTQSIGQLSTIAAGTAPVTLYERTFRNGTTLPVEFEVKIANNANVTVASSANATRDAEQLFTVPLPSTFFNGVPCVGEYCNNMPRAYPALPPPRSATSNAPLPWMLQLVDGAGVASTGCTYVDDETQRCTLIGRAAGAPPTEVRAIATITRIAGLNPTGAALQDSTGLSANSAVNRDRCFQKQGYIVGNCVNLRNCPFACTLQGITADQMHVTSVSVQVSGTHNGITVKPDFAMTTGIVGEPQRAQVAGNISYAAGTLFWNGQ